MASTYRSQAPSARPISAHAVQAKGRTLEAPGAIRLGSPALDDPLESLEFLSNLADKYMGKVQLGSHWITCARGSQPPRPSGEIHQRRVEEQDGAVERLARLVSRLLAVARVGAATSRRPPFALEVMTCPRSSTGRGIQARERTWR